MTLNQSLLERHSFMLLALLAGVLLPGSPARAQSLPPPFILVIDLDEDTKSLANLFPVRVTPGTLILFEGGLDKNGGGLGLNSDYVNISATAARLHSDADPSDPGGTEPPSPPADDGIFNIDPKLPVVNLAENASGATIWTPKPGQAGFANDINGDPRTDLQLVYSISSDPPETPEPGTVALLASFGLTGAAFLARRRKQGGKVA